MCSSLIYSHVAVCTVRYVMSLVFASLCYFLIIRPMFFNIPSMFVFLFCMFYFLFCVFCVFVLFYALFLLLYTQVYRSLPQGRNPVSVNKYHIVYTLFRPYIYIYIHIFSHLVVCLSTGQKPLPKRALHIVRSRASSFK